MAWHARKQGSKSPLCGQVGPTSGMAHTLTPKEWNASSPERRCAKCTEQLRKRRDGAAKVPA
jgi:hypothetical protein